MMLVRQQELSKYENVLKLKSELLSSSRHARKCVLSRFRPRGKNTDNINEYGTLWRSTV